MKFFASLLLLLWFALTGLLALFLSFLGTLAVIAGTIGVTTCITTRCTLFFL